MALYKKIPQTARQFKPIVILDNLSSHKSSLVTDYCRGKMELVYITTYSCQFNSIETYWAYAKRRFKKINFNMKGNYKDDKEFNKKVKESLEINKE